MHVVSTRTSEGRTVLVPQPINSRRRARSRLSRLLFYSCEAALGDTFLLRGVRILCHACIVILQGTSCAVTIQM